jgi:hypothetical protein
MRTRLASEFFVDPCWRTPALRPNRAEMSGAVFVGLVAGWSGFLTGMLFILVSVRLFSWG